MADAASDRIELSWLTWCKKLHKMNHTFIRSDALGKVARDMVVTHGVTLVNLLPHRLLLRQGAGQSVSSRSAPSVSVGTAWRELFAKNQSWPASRARCHRLPVLTCRLTRPQSRCRGSF